MNKRRLIDIATNYRPATMERLFFFACNTLIGWMSVKSACISSAWKA